MKIFAHKKFLEIKIKIIVEKTQSLLNVLCHLRHSPLFKFAISSTKIEWGRKGGIENIFSLQKYYSVRQNLSNTACKSIKILHVNFLT